MKCMSCESEINPKWKHAIDSNICPFCGQNVMEEKLKELFSELRTTLDELEVYADRVDDWMLSNYGFIRIDSPDLIHYVPKDQLKSAEVSKSKHHADDVENGKFTVKIRTENGEEEIMAEKIQSEARTNAFFKRAEVVKPSVDGSAAEKTQRLKSMVSQIKKTGSAAITADSSGFISAEMMENADPEAVAEMQSLMSESPAVASSLSTSDDDDIPAVVLAMASKGSGKGNSSVNAADMLKLQQMQDRLANSHKNFESGENRGGKGGGFSRAG